MIVVLEVASGTDGSQRYRLHRRYLVVQKVAKDAEVTYWFRSYRRYVGESEGCYRGGYRGKLVVRKVVCGKEGS